MSLNLKENEQEAKPVYSKKKHVLIDSDSLIYRACHVGEKVCTEAEVAEDHPLFKELAPDLFTEQKVVLRGMIDGIVNDMETELNTQGATIEAVSLLFTPKKGYCDANGLKLNFRYDLITDFNEEYGEEVPGYKANRKNMKLPEGIPEMYEHCMVMDNMMVSDHSEADDLIVQMKNSDPDKYVISCIDKDIYEGCPGTHYNFNKREWIETSKEEAELFYMRQCMTGDSSDGIKGIYRFGPKAAEKLLPEWEPMEDMWVIVVGMFIEKGYTEEYAVLMYRLVSLNQMNSEGVIELWKPGNW